MFKRFIEVNGVPTNVTTWGQSINEPLKKKEIVLCITGNPGVAGFYLFFLSTIYKVLLGNIPVWIIGHAGHDLPDGKTPMTIPALKTNRSLYDLNGQIKHKAEFIRKYVPADVKVHLIGHSIGAHISLELLKIKDISDRIHHCYLLFPTIQHMAVSPNGKRYQSLMRPYFKFFYISATFFAFLPLIIRTVIVSILFFIISIPRHFVSTCLTYISPSVLSKVVSMANDEMDEVIEPDYEHIRANRKRLTFFYSTTDGWTPKEHYLQLVENVSGVNATLSDEYDHAFVLRTSEAMGTLVAGWIFENQINK